MDIYPALFVEEHICWHANIFLKQNGLKKRFSIYVPLRHNIPVEEYLY